jgi:hypothetical protein
MYLHVCRLGREAWSGICILEKRWSAYSRLAIGFAAAPLLSSWLEEQEVLRGMDVVVPGQNKTPLISRRPLP